MLTKFLLALMLVSTSYAHAECVEAVPMCHAMHELDGAFDCVTGETPAALCSADSIADMAQASKDSRAALLALQPAGTADSVIADINGLFDQLDQAVVDLKAAGSDATAKAAAISKIKAIRKQGHMEFKKK